MDVSLSDLVLRAFDDWFTKPLRQRGARKNAETLNSFTSEKSRKFFHEPDALQTAALISAAHWSLIAIKESIADRRGTPTDSEKEAMIRITRALDRSWGDN